MTGCHLRDDLIVDRLYALEELWWERLLAFVASREFDVRRSSDPPERAEAAIWLQGDRSLRWTVVRLLEAWYK